MIRGAQGRLACLMNNENTMEDLRFLCWYCRHRMISGRVEGLATEYVCSPCGYSHTVRADDPDHIYHFFPADIDRAFSDEVKPLFPR
jgi:DNA-directed RNA polymerase subunit RPC12/RpoP